MVAKKEKKAKKSKQTQYKSQLVKQVAADVREICDAFLASPAENLEEDLEWQNLRDILKGRCYLRLLTYYTHVPSETE